jgi:hypothetical protein
MKERFHGLSMPQIWKFGQIAGRHGSWCGREYHNPKSGRQIPLLVCCRIGRA